MALHDKRWCNCLIKWEKLDKSFHNINFIVLHFVWPGYLRLKMRFHTIPPTRGGLNPWKKVIKNEKSLKKDGRKKFFPRVIRTKRESPEESFFRPSFFNDFSFLITFFQGFNPPLDEDWPLIHWRRKDTLLALNNLPVDWICPGNLGSNDWIFDSTKYQYNVSLGIWKGWIILELNVKKQIISHKFNYKWFL